MYPQYKATHSILKVHLFMLKFGNTKINIYKCKYKYSAAVT